MYWNFGRWLSLLAGLGFALVGVQVSLFHYRGNFRQWTMWAPVATAPVLALLLLWFALTPVRGLHVTLYWLLWVEALAGLGGFAMHLRGVSQRLGGIGLNNILTGPPFVLPLTLTAFSVLGLMAVTTVR